MHLYGFQEAYRLACQPLESYTEKKVFTFEVALIMPRPIGEETSDNETLKQVFEISKGLIAALTETVDQHPTIPKIQELPQPTGLTHATDKTPHL